MPRARIVAVAGLAALGAAGLIGPAHAARWTVEPGRGDLQAVVDRAADGDTVELLPGEHRGPLEIAHAIALVGMPGAVLKGTGAGSVVTVRAPKAVVRDLAITGSGTSLETMDAGVAVEQSAAGAVVENNRLEGNLFGVYLHGAPDALVRRNAIVGMRQGRVSESGNGISLWNAPGAKVVDNDVRFGRDGIFVISSRRNVISGNRFRDLRFAVHYMYGNEGEIIDNVSRGNTIGYALMYSQRLVVRGNLSDHDRDQGMLFNYTNGARISGNLVEGGMLPVTRWTAPRGDGHAGAETPAPAPGVGLRNAPERCVFIYNANANRFTGNWFEGCDTGIHFTAGSERNQISGNAFVGNRNQVKYVGTRRLDWSVDGRGNYWSDNPAFDLDGDGVADTAYRPNDVVDTVLWTAPQAKLLVNSPAVQVIRWAQSQFPALLPGGVVDSRPLVVPPPRPAIAFGGGS